MERWIEQNIILLPLYLYDHSGITMNTTGFNCRWDSGQVGFIFMHKSVAVETWGKKICTDKVRQKAINCLIAEVEEYDQYLTGDVYRYSVEEEKTGDYVDGDGGYYGKEGEMYAMQEAQSSVDYFVQIKVNEKAKQVKKWVKNKVPLQYRTA